eukprot:scaffold50496_cov69-Phaeocystis_antarctica.AAC.4
MMTRSQTRIAELETRIAELEKENETLKKENAENLKGEVKVEDKCVWYYACGYDVKFYFKTEEEADEWWEWYETTVGKDSIEGDIYQVWKHDPDGQARFQAEFIKEDGSTDEDTDDEDEDTDDEYFSSDTHNEEVECNDKKFKVSANAYVLMKQWQLDGENVCLVEEITGTGKGGVIISRDLKELIEATKEAWMAEVTDDEDEEDE